MPDSTSEQSLAR
jgi:hypothetical protein